MNLKTAVTSVALLAASSPVVLAQPSSPSGGATWMVFGGGFLFGLGAGLLWCWLWCKKKKGNDRDERK